MPVGVVLLAGGLLTVFLLRRRRRRRQQGQQQRLLGRRSKGPAGLAGVRDLETGPGPPDGMADQEALPGQGRDQVSTTSHCLWHYKVYSGRQSVCLNKQTVDHRDLGQVLGLALC